MSMQTKINGFTTWANYRLQLVHHDAMDNLLTDFMRGFNLKMLVESLTGRPFRKMKTFDGLSDSQKETRVQWTVDELKTCGIIDREVKVDCRLVTLHSFTHITDLLWHAVAHDIEFLWLRSAYMRQNNQEKLIVHPFSCIPPLCPTKKEYSVSINSKASAMERDINMISQNKLKKPKNTIAYVYDLINSHLKMTRDGRKLAEITNLSDVLHVKVFCALVNSIIADTFISNVLLNDRWTFNLIIQTISEIFRFPFCFSLDDFIEGDKKGICCFFTFFFMAGYYLRQSKAAIERLDFLSLSTIKYNEELSELKSSKSSGKNIAREEKVRELVKNYNKEICLINANYDVVDCRNWVRVVNIAQQKLWATIGEAMKSKYDIITMPMNLSVKELSEHLFVNLDITTCPGYYELTAKEVITSERKVIIRNKETGKFFDCIKMHCGKKQRTARGVLGISSASSQELVSKNFPDFHIFLEALSSNKFLKAGSLFLYQIFPDDLNSAQNLLFKAVKNGELDSAKNLISFFQSEPSFISGSYGNAKTTALHLACKLSKFDLVLYLLEQNADLNKQNYLGNTPLHVAIENGQQQARDVAKLLIEWGANVNIPNKNKLTALEDFKNKEFCLYLQGLHDYWRETVPRLINGDLELMRNIMNINHDCMERLSTLRSRCANGSTLLHLAVRFNALDIITQLFVLGLDINVRDHKFATPLHRAKSSEVVDLLIKYGSDIFLTDKDQNTPLHCLFEIESTNEIDCDAIRIMVLKGINMLQRNCRGYTSVHSAAAIGKIDAIQTLIQLDNEGTLKQTLNSDSDETVSSVVYLAIKNDHLTCARWLLENGFVMRKEEGSELVQKVLAGKIICANVASTFELLFENSACVDASYQDGNSCLHLASTSIDMLSCLQQFIKYKCDVNMQNDNGWTPLFFATNSNNYQAAAILLKHGADITLKDLNGLTAFDYIDEYDHWITCGLFVDFIAETLQAYNLKKTRDLVRSITDKLKKC